MLKIQNGSAPIELKAFRNRLLSLLVIDVFMIFGLSLGIASVSFGLFFIFSPIIPLILWPFLRKPYRVIKFSTSAFVNIVRLLSAVLILYLGYTQIPHIFDVMLSEDLEIYNSALQAPLVNLFLAIFTPILIFTLILEGFAAVLFLGRYKSQGRIDKDWVLPVGETLLFGCAIAVFVFSVFFGIALVIL